MSKIVHSVPLSAKSFSEADLKLSLQYINPEVYPGYYSSGLAKGFTYVDRRIMEIKDIVHELESFFDDLDTKLGGTNVFATQAAAIRTEGRGLNSAEVQSNMEKDGFELSHLPISVAYCPNKAKILVDGRTRLEKLIAAGFVNVIVDYYICDSWEAYFFEALKRNKPPSARSPMTKANIINHCNFSIKQGWIGRTWDEIKTRVEELTDGNIKKEVLYKIIHNVLHGSGYTAEVLSLDEDKAKRWLKSNGYHDNENGNGIYYKVVSASAWSKAICASANLLVDEYESQGKHVKELRVVLHTGTLDGADPARSWQDKTDSFRRGWKEDLNAIAQSFFRNSERRAVIRLYGVIPAVTYISDLYPMDKLVMFHVGKLKENYFVDLRTDPALEEALGIS